MYEVRLNLFNGDRLDYRFASPGWRRSREAVPLDGLAARAAEIDARTCQRLVFAGGSPLEHPRFDDLVARCRELGLANFALETDGKSLARPGVVESLCEKGFHQICVVLPSVRERIHDAMTHEPGTLEAALEGVRRASLGSAKLYLIVPIARLNVAEVQPLLEWARSLPGPVTGVLLAPPDIEKVPASFQRLVLPYSLLARLSARVFRYCQGNRLEYGFTTRRGVTPCAADDTLDQFGQVFHDRVQYFRHTDDVPLARVAACTSCSLQESCRGVEADYVKLLGENEFKPVPLDVSMNWKLRRFNSLEQREFNNISPFENQSKKNTRGIVRINGYCNMSCSFCFIDRTVGDFDKDPLLDEIRQIRASGTDHLVLSGGEPTLHPDLASLVAEAKALGFQTIEIQTNGVKAHEFGYAKRLADAGLNKVTVSLHSVDPERSDEITRLPKAFPQTVAAMHNFRNLGVLTQVAHVITKMNYLELPDTVRFLRREFPEDAGHLSICFGIAQGISDLVFSWVIPRFDEIKPYVRDALDYCIETGVGFGGMIGQGGYPPCMLDGEMKYYQDKLDKVFISGDFTEQFYKAERCRECSFDPYCVGVRRAYVDNYGDEEIRPFRAEIVGAYPIPVKEEIAHAKPRQVAPPQKLVAIGKRPAL
ncbi:MAG TPA: radical SAM protein [Polyangiaceae bacterium]|nr:radical SAM protein [Polyangiaceae bacterium]